MHLDLPSLVDETLKGGVGSPAVEEFKWFANWREKDTCLIITGQWSNTSGGANSVVAFGKEEHHRGFTIARSSFLDIWLLSGLLLDQVKKCPVDGRSSSSAA